MLKNQIQVYIFLLLVVTILTNCNNSKPQTNKNSDSPKEYTVKNKLLGIWTYDTNENATFKITEDSIYYIDHNATYKYDLVGDSIKIKFDDFISTGKIYFVGDTLAIQHETGTDKYWHFEN